VSANPIAATLEKLGVGQRSGVSPVCGSLRSQNQLKVLRSSESRNAVCRAVRADGGNDPLDVPAGEIGAAVVHADAIRNSVAHDHRPISPISDMAT
jgi:hypothetical protein